MKKVRENARLMVFGFYTSVSGKGQFNRVVHSFTLLEQILNWERGLLNEKINKN